MLYLGKFSSFMEYDVVSYLRVVIRFIRFANMYIYCIFTYIGVELGGRGNFPWLSFSGGKSPPLKNLAILTI